MTQQAYEQTVKQQEHIEDLLTRESFDEWFENLTEEEWQDLQFHYKEVFGHKLTALQIYLKEHGLPLESIIKAL